MAEDDFHPPTVSLSGSPVDEARDAAARLLLAAGALYGLVLSRVSGHEVTWDEMAQVHDAALAEIEKMGP